MKSGSKKEKLRAVVDTNLIVAGIAGRLESTPVHLLEAWRAGRFILITSPPLLAEVRDVLNRAHVRQHFSLNSITINALLRQLTTKAFVVPGELKINVIREDPADNIVLAAAQEGLATHIVTGDAKHLLPLTTYNGINIITARAFLAMLD